jgi:LEA14-like dessication related protein
MPLFPSLLASLVASVVVAAAGGPGALRFSVAVAGVTDARVTISGPESELPAGPFRGSITVNGSSAELPISGVVAISNGKFRLPVTVRYAELPEAWTEGFNTETFTYRLRGASEAGGSKPREWTGTQSFREVEVSGEGHDKFLALQNVRLTEMSLLSSEGLGELMLVNPLGFDVKIAEATYALFAEGEPVGEGSARGLILRGRRKNILRLPIAVDHASLLSAAGRAVAAGGDVAVRLKGKLVLRLRGGDVAVPLDLSGRMSGAS